MSTVRMRPTFRARLTADRDTAIAHIREALKADERFAGRWRGKGRWAEVYVPHAERRFWSPHLSIRLDRDDGPGCTLFGRFAPHPELWTFFIETPAVPAHKAQAIRAVGQPVSAKMIDAVATV